MATKKQQGREAHLTVLSAGVQKKATGMIRHLEDLGSEEERLLNRDERTRGILRIT